MPSTTEAALGAAIDDYTDSNRRIALLSLRLVADLVHEAEPAATGLPVGTSDQDMDGSLVWTGALFDNADGDELDGDFDELHDELFGPLSNLDDRTASVWEPFLVGTYSKRKGTYGHLDIGKILAEVEAPTAPVIVLENGDDGPEVRLYGVDAEVITVDFGRADLSDDDERAEWLESQAENLAGLPVGHPARVDIEALVKLITDRYR